MRPAKADQIMLDVNGMSIEMQAFGQGPDILFLQSGFWLADERPAAERLATLGRVIAPVHPGFGDHEAPGSVTCIDDLAYLYLDLIDAMRLRDVVVIGAGFGGWIAAEMAVKTDSALAALVLIDPFGIKGGDREARNITDVFAHPEAELLARAFVSPKPFEREARHLTDKELARRVRSREAYARFGWSPYMHDPKLPSRLHRVRVPTLVLWGEGDRIVDFESCNVFARKIPGAQCARIANAGHFPHLEQPEHVMTIISEFTCALDAGNFRILTETG